jgi:hypothetical protein
MAKIGNNGKVSSEILIVLSEEEAGALDALAGYGVDAFLKTFYEKMGEAYLKPYEKGLRSLFKSVHGGDCSVSSFMRRSKEARAVMAGAMKAVRVEESE